MSEELKSIIVNGIEFVRRDSRDDYYRAVRAETLLEDVPALVEALREITTGEWDDLDPDDGLHPTSVRTFARDVLAAWEQKASRGW